MSTPTIASFMQSSNSEYRGSRTGSVLRGQLSRRRSTSSSSPRANPARLRRSRSLGGELIIMPRQRSGVHRCSLRLMILSSLQHRLYGLDARVEVAELDRVKGHTRELCEHSRFPKRIEIRVRRHLLDLLGKDPPYIRGGLYRATRSALAVARRVARVVAAVLWPHAVDAS